MSTKYAEKEREFIDALAEDTGRDLAAWMTAIVHSGLSERNAIIDWLRHQGFQFAKASWLERIHHNGGQLIYGGDSRTSAVNANANTPRRPRASEHAPTDRLPTPQAILLDSQDVQNLLVSAKGLRPLAEHVLREVGRSVPDVQVYAAPPFIVMASPLPFAALLPNARMLRLFGEFGPANARVQSAEPVNKTAPPFSAMLLLDDARSVDQEFHRLIARASESR